MLQLNPKISHRGLFCLIWLVLGLVWSTASHAQIIQGEDFDLDFTHHDALKGRIETFPAALTFSNRGLGYDAEANRILLQTRFQTVQPRALGYAWTPTSAVNIRANLKVDFKSDEVYSLGRLYVRYSPDAEHWSTWQTLTGGKREHKTSLIHAYEGELSVPDVERLPYFDLLAKFYKVQPEQVGDEEAAVRWIVTQDPHYFEKTLPFIGYIEFLFETPLESGQHIKSLHCDLVWGLPGLHMMSRRETEALKKGLFLPWSYHAAPAKIEHAPEKTKESASPPHA